MFPTDTSNKTLMVPVSKVKILDWKHRFSLDGLRVEVEEEVGGQVIPAAFEGRVHHQSITDRDTQRQTTTHTHSSVSSPVCLWRRENKQTPHREAQVEPGSDPEPSRCEATVQTVQTRASLWRRTMFLFHWFLFLPYVTHCNNHVAKGQNWEWVI